MEVPPANDKNLEKSIHERLRKFDPSKIFVVVMINYDNDYHNYKLHLNGLGVSSQVIHRKSFGGRNGFNLSVASNIMKQINSKSGGESI